MQQTNTGYQCNFHGKAMVEWLVDTSKKEISVVATKAISQVGANTQKGFASTIPVSNVTVREQSGNVVSFWDLAFDKQLEILESARRSKLPTFVEKKESVSVEFNA